MIYQTKALTLIHDYQILERNMSKTNFFLVKMSKTN